MSGAFKKGFIVGAVGAVIGLVVYALIGGRDIRGFFGLALICFAIFLFIGYVVGRVTSKGEEEFEYEDD